MKNFLILFFFVFLAKTHAKNHLIIIWQRDGTCVSYQLRKKPVVTFEQSNLVLSTENVNTIFPLSLYSKMTFAVSEEDDVDVIENPIAHPLFDFSKDYSSCTILPNEFVSIYDTNGRLLKHAQADSKGNIIRLTSNLTRGVYIIKSDTTTFKVQIK